MSLFEISCLEWFYSNINKFTIRMQIIGDLVRDAGMNGGDKTLFLQAMNIIYDFHSNVTPEGKTDGS